MGLIDFILNLAGLLLWFAWSAARFDPLAKTSPATLTGTLRRAEPSRTRRWPLLAAVPALLLVRAWFYRQLGPAVNWAAGLDLGAVTLYFRSDHFALMALYSTLSFARLLAISYFWLLFLVMVNRRETRPDPFLRLIQLQLGWPGRWPRGLQASVPWAGAALLWAALHPLLVQAGVTSAAQSWRGLAIQGLLVGAALYLSLKYLIPAILLADLIASYVYLGSNPFWDFLQRTARGLLRPLRRWPLQVGKVDFAPLLGIVLVLMLLHRLPAFLLAMMEARKLNVWPP